jgi:hypothetical protein
MNCTNELYKSGCLGLLDFADLHGLQRLGWGRECNADTPLEEDWLVLIGHAVVHQRAVPVPFNVGMQTMLAAAPINFTTVLAVPARKTIENCHGLHCVLIFLQLHEAVPEESRFLEIKGDVNEIVQTSKANFIQDHAELFV